MFEKMVRRSGRPLKALLGFTYHYARYVRHAAWSERLGDVNVRNYLVAKVYHGLEKSLSYSIRRPGAGHENARLLSRLIGVARRSPQRLGFHDRVAPIVLGKFLSESNSGVLREELGAYADIQANASTLGGTKTLSIDALEEGKLQNPESFFGSRHSVREFAHGAVPRATVDRAVSLALKTPSVCNRQPWHVYHLDDPDQIRSVLKHQNGNRGFGDGIPTLLVIASDLRAFGPGAEHYQHWIDGGLFSMSLIYAFHSLGYATCCLNWSASPGQDIALRRALQIEDAHSVIMLLAVGLPRTENNLCCSPRRPAAEFVTYASNQKVEA